MRTAASKNQTIPCCAVLKSLILACLLVRIVSFRVIPFGNQNNFRRFPTNREHILWWKVLSGKVRRRSSSSSSNSPVPFNNKMKNDQSDAKKTVRSALDELSPTGAFQRRDAVWRSWISREPGAEFPPAKDRYHLYVAYACPWAHRTLLVRAIKGLQDVISVTVVHPVWQKTKPNDPNDTHHGWIFGRSDDETPLVNTIGKGGPFKPSYPGNDPDPILGASSIRNVYEYANDTNGKYTVPILWDKQLSTIVSNESSEIIRMLNTEFNEFATNPQVDLYPQDLREEIDSLNSWIYPTINNGVYRCGFATTQAAYDEAIQQLTTSFDRIESILSERRYLASDTRLTEADIRLFVTLIRFDEVYHTYFKTNTRMVSNSPAILNYCRRIYQLPHVAETVNMEQIKLHYFCSHPTLNHYSIVPRGMDFESLLKQPIPSLQE